MYICGYKNNYNLLIVSVIFNRGSPYKWLNNRISLVTLHCNQCSRILAKSYSKIAIPVATRQKKKIMRQPHKQSSHFGDKSPYLATLMHYV